MGSIIAVIHNGKLEWADACGYANDFSKKKADVETLYQAASITKSINALGILKLVQGGRLSLDRDIRDDLKTWNFHDNELSKGRLITLRNLLSHTAGLSTGGFKGYTKGRSLPSLNQISDGKRPSNSEAVIPMLLPGTKRQYSGGGTLITKKILLDNISLDYAAFMKKTI